MPEKMMRSKNDVTHEPLMSKNVLSIILFLIITLAFLFYSPSDTATEYYVNDTSTNLDEWCTGIGDDTNNGLSPATPKATVQAIIDAYDLEPGDVVHIDTGNYILASNIYITESDQGAESNPVVFEASPYGVIMDCVSTEYGKYAFYMDEGDYITIRTAISTKYSGETQYFMKLINGYSGIRMSNADYCKLERLEISHAQYGILTNESIDATYSNNLIHDNGIGIHLDWDSNNTMIVNNTIVNNSTQLSLNCVGINISLKNNIILADGSGKFGISFTSHDGSFSTSFKYSNYNLIYAANGAYIATQNGDYIVYKNIADWQTFTGMDSNSFSLNPGFVDPDNGDYHLKSTGGSYHENLWIADTESSPGIDAGDLLDKYSNEPDNNGGRVNLGAYGNTSQASKNPPGRELCLTTLNGGDIIQGAFNIRWLITGQGWKSGDTVKIEYSNDNGSSWNIISESVLAAHGAFLWNTSSLPDNPHYRIRIRYSEDTNITAESIGWFYMHNGPIQYYVNDATTNLDEWCTGVGDDTNNGITPATPKATVQAILDEYNLEEGDVVHIDTGYYVLSHNIEISESDQGTETAPVIFEASPYGVTIDRNSTSSGSYAFMLLDCDYIKIQTAKSSKHSAAAQYFMKLTGGLCGIYLENADFCTITRLDISFNQGYGIGKDQSGSYVTYSNNIIYKNGGGGIKTGLWSIVINNTIVKNNGHQLSLDSTTSITNNIIWADGSENYALYTSNALEYSDYNLLYTTNGAYIGYYNSGYKYGNINTFTDWQFYTGNDLNSFSLDPKFVDIDNNDYHLKSTSGSYQQGIWKTDSEDSPGIDTGDPSGEFNNEPENNGDNINLGAYGGTELASRSKSRRNLIITFPYGGEYIYETYEIKWLITGEGWQSGDTVKIECSNDDGATWDIITNSILASEGSYLWDTTSFQDSDYYLIRLTSNEDINVTLESAGIFRVKNSPVHYYVNDNSSDLDIWCTATGDSLNDGLTPSTPKATIQEIIDSYTLKQGDLVHIDTGAYVLSNNIEIREFDQGTEKGPVIFEGSPYGVIIDRNFKSTSDSVFYLNDCDYITIRTATSNKYPDEAQHFMKLTAGSKGIRLENADFCTITGLEISSNHGTGIGGLYSANNIYSNNLIYNNGFSGISLSPGESNSIIINNTIVKNDVAQIFTHKPGNVICRNNIIWADGPESYGIYVDYIPLESDYNLIYATNGANLGSMLLTIGVSEAYKSLADWQTETGGDLNSISLDPKFVDPDNGDYHLKSTSGSYHNSAWTSDAENSPGIDAGDPIDDFSNEPSWHGLRINLGAYGGTNQASKTIPGDIDGDGLPDDIEDSGCTNLYDSDTDNDGISDGIEDKNHNGVKNSGETDPCNNDTDNDGLNDGQEDKNHNGIIDSGETNPINSDTDNDGMPDGWEDQYDLDPLINDANEDDDGDGYSNLKEYKRKTIPNDYNSQPSKGMPWLPLLLGE